MITEEQYNELLTKMDKFYTWAKKINERVTQLEAAYSPTTSNLANPRLWTKEEEEFLVAALHNEKSIRQKCLELETAWKKQFGYSRSYDSLRKKFKRLTA